MSRHLMALVALTLGLAAGGLAGEPLLAPEPGLLVLRNGRILEGRIIRVGDRYRVAMGEDDEVSLPAAQVEFHCRDLREAYQLKRAALRPGRVDELLELAEWCLRQDLFQETAEQLLAALALDPADGRIGGLERRLQVALEGERQDLPKPHLPRPTISTTEVQQAIDALPPGSVEWYTSRIQPLLLNRCATGRCHGARTESGFRLAQPSPGHRLTTRITHRNLYHTLRQLDRGQPETSRLLTTIQSPHADLPGPVFGDHEQENFRSLRDWVRHLGRGVQPEPPATIARPSPVLLRPFGPQTRLRVPFAAGPPSVEQAATAEQAANTTGPPLAGRDSAGQPAPGQPIAGQPITGQPVAGAVVPAGAMLPAGPDRQSTGLAPVAPVDRRGASGERFGPTPVSAGNPAEVFEPRDPFDPEIFNRRYLPTSAVPAAPRR